MKRGKMIRIAMALLAITILFLTACAPQSNIIDILEKDLLDYAIFYDSVEGHLHENFLEQNKTHFPFSSDDLPDYRCQIIDTKGKLNRAFDEFPQTINFEQEFLVIYLFTDIYYAFGCELQTIAITRRTITVEILHQMAEKRPDGATPPSTSFPMQRCLAIILPNCSYETVNVNINY